MGRHRMYSLRPEIAADEAVGGVPCVVETLYFHSEPDVLVPAVPTHFTMIRWSTGPFRITQAYLACTRRILSWT